MDARRLLADLTPREFEKICLKLLEAEGYKTQWPPGSQDIGVDFIATDSDGTRWVVECKLATTPLPPAAVHEVGAYRSVLKAERALIIVAPAGVTASALEAADRFMVNIWTLDAISELLARHPAVLREARKQGRRHEDLGKFLLTEITLSNFRGFESCAVKLHPRINALVGINGAGKSSVLDAIAALWSWLPAKLSSAAAKRAPIRPEDIRRGAREASISLRASIDGASHAWSLSAPRRSENTELDELRDAIAYLQRSLLTSQDRSLPILVYYPTRREASSRSASRHRVARMEIYSSALSARRDHALFLRWFRQREDIENERRARGSKRQRDPQLQAARQAIEALLPGFKDPHIKRGANKLLLSKDKTELEFDQLSAGEKALITLSADLAWRLSLANPTLKRPTHGYGVVMIDEFELHLHPSWQRSALPRLLETFPNCQFIISTHSPQVLSSVPAGAIRILDGFQVFEGAPSTFGRDSNSILSEVMDVPAYRCDEWCSSHRRTPMPRLSRRCRDNWCGPTSSS